MPRIPITVMGYLCGLCEHEWIPQSLDGRTPLACPACGSAGWDTPRRTATTYEHFRDRVQTVLRASPRGRTWTEIRTEARLPQKLPNNKWVRRLEDEIGLVRRRDQKVILWSLAGSEGTGHGRESGG